MRLKLAVSRDPKHTDVVSAIGWANSEELISCGDDHQMLRWNGVTGDVAVVAALPETMFPTDIHWFPRVAPPNAGGGQKKQTTASSPEMFVLTSADGHFYLISKLGRVEKSVEAHSGAVLMARWSHDGSSLLTVGEDGRLKIWSRTGLLRSTLVSATSPIYAACWTNNSSQVVYCCGERIHLHSMQSNSKATDWRAHDQVITCLDCNASNSLIVSGAEDCKYKVWDSFGRALYSSQAHSHPITSVAWAPSGQLFAVGSFNTLRLCDRSGWSHTLEKPNTGSILRLRWCADSTQVAAACANGHVLFGSTIDHRVEYRQFEAVQIKRRTIEIRNCTNDAREKVEVRDRVTKMALAWDHLVVSTTSQLYIYNSNNWNTPAISDLKEGSVSLILMSSKLMLIVDGGSVLVIDYAAKPKSTIKLAGMRTQVLTENTVSLSDDCLALRDTSDLKLIHLLDPTSGKPTGDAKITHTQPILQVAVDQSGSAKERRVALVDKNNDLFLASVHSAGRKRKLTKLGAMVGTVAFNASVNMLVGVEDSRVMHWVYPAVVYTDSELLPRTIASKEVGDFGNGTQLISFVGSRVTVRRADGSVVSTGINPFATALHEYVIKAKWDHAVQLCRHVKEPVLWAALAAMASANQQLNTAEIAYGAIDEAEKVQFLTQIRQTSNKDVKASDLALVSGNVEEAERVLLQSGNVLRAILLNITLYKWNRALELALKHKQHVDTVIGYKQQYLQQFGWKETNKLFLHHATEVEVDWQYIQENVAKELG